jgi:hypothetical protein
MLLQKINNANPLLFLRQLFFLKSSQRRQAASHPSDTLGGSLFAILGMAVSYPPVLLLDRAKSFRSCDGNCTVKRGYPRLKRVLRRHQIADTKALSRVVRRQNCFHNQE